MYSKNVYCTLLLVVVAVAAKKKPDGLVEMVPGSDEKVTGKLALFKHKDGVLIEGTIHGLKPGLHGFHVHDKGLLGDKCMDAGPHFNPTKKVHAGPKDLHRHAGDLGNVFAEKNGVAKFTIYDAHISLHPQDKNYIGKRSFVVHEKPDDLGRGGDDESLRTGNAGARLSCGIIIVLGHSLKHPPPVYRPKKSHSGHHGGHSSGGGDFSYSSPSKPQHHAVRAHGNFGPKNNYRHKTFGGGFHDSYGGSGNLKSGGPLSFGSHFNVVYNPEPHLGSGSSNPHIHGISNYVGESKVIPLAPVAYKTLAPTYFALWRR